LQFSSEYIKLPWYNHLLAIAGFLVPPAGVFLLIGSFRWVKEYAPIYLGVLLFLILHSAMQGKQERFMYTMFPFYIIIGYVGWCSISDKITWQKWKKVERLIWIFAALVNGIALLFLSTWYGKKARVEAMIYMQDKPIVAAIVANEELDNNHMLPRAYSGQWFDVIEYRAQFNFDDFSKQLSASNQKPNYLFFEVAPTSENHKLHARWRTLFPKIKLEKRIEGSIMDKWHYKANPVVKNFDYVIYKLEGSK
jgi:asparagine N-glycosylation enzyme membrane subunit Stt3